MTWSAWIVRIRPEVDCGSFGSAASLKRSPEVTAKTSNNRVATTIRIAHITAERRDDLFRPPRKEAPQKDLYNLGDFGTLQPWSARRDSASGWRRCCRT